MMYFYVEPTPSDGGAGPAPHAPPSAPPTQPAPTASVSVSPTAGTDGKLPTTGPGDVGWLIVAGLMVVLLGAMLVALVARMRRA